MIESCDSLLRIFVAGYSDFSRGGHGKWTRKFIPFISHKHIFLLLLALNYTNVIGWSWWALIFIAWFMIAGVALGTGDPVGKIVEGHNNHGNDNNKLGKWEKWQYLIKTDNAFTNHAILGGLWSFPSIGLAFIKITWIFVFIGHVIGFYVAGFLVRLVDKQDRWKLIEPTRSALAMTIVLIGIFIVF